MKKVLSTALALAMVLSLAACSTGGTSTSSSAPSSSGDASTPEEKNFSVAMVTDVGGVNDQSFNQSAWEGLQALQEKGGYDVKYLESVQESDYTPNLDKVGDEEHDLIWGVGYMMADAIKDAATRNPDKLYAIVDNSYGDETPENIIGVVFKAEEPSYLVGYIAGHMTTTDKVGFVGGMEGANIAAFEYGYRAGVAKAAADLGKEITVDVQYANSFSDAALGKSIALKQYENGCDIIFHAAGNVGNGVIEAAVEKNLYVIGVDRDQNYLAENNVITSAMKKVGEGMSLVTERVKAGEQLGGTTVTYGLAEGTVGIAPTSDKHVPAEILEKVAELEKTVASGEIVVPMDEETFNAYVATLA